MFKEMRRHKQLLNAEETAAVLERGTSGVLALSGEDGYPYAVPLSYVFDGEKLYFHSAKAGHKLEALRRCPKASFCVIDQDQIVPEEYTTYFRSVIAFGAIQVPSEGKPIIMLGDRQTTGGYTKIANVISADFRLLGQLKAGDKVRFEKVSIGQAQEALLNQRAALKTLRHALDG